jgi:site-specific recombinase XerC
LLNAIVLWAQSNIRPETFERDYKLQDKIAAVRAFFAFAKKHPGQVTPTDVAAWRQHLESLGQKPATVYARLSRLSSFYRWLLSNPQLSAHIQANPVLQARPRYSRRWCAILSVNKQPSPLKSIETLQIYRKLIAESQLIPLSRRARVRRNANAPAASKSERLVCCLVSRAVFPAAIA